RQGPLKLLLGGARLLAQVLDLATQPLHLPQLGRDVAAGPLGCGDAVRVIALARTQALGGRRRGPPLAVADEHLVHEADEVGVAPRERGANGIGLLADALEVEHAGAAVPRRPTFPTVSCSRSPPSAT